MKQTPYQIQFLNQTPKKLFLDHAISLCPKDPVTQSPDKISKVTSKCFVPVRCEVCVPNLSSLASKLLEQIEMKYEQAIPPTPVHACGKI